jgi:hypothetical protein
LDADGVAAYSLRAKANCAGFLLVGERQSQGCVQGHGAIEMQPRPGGREVGQQARHPDGLLSGVSPLQLDFLVLFYAVIETAVATTHTFIYRPPGGEA